MHANIHVLERFRRLLDERETRPLERGTPREQATRASGATLDMPEPDAGARIDRFSPSSDWDGLIHEVEGIVQHVHETDRRLHERERRIEQLLVRAEHELIAGAERVRTTEARLREAETWAEQAVAGAAGRAQVAQARSQGLEAIFDRLREAILAGCAEAAAPAAGRPPSPQQAPLHIRRVA